MAEVILTRRAVAELSRLRRYSLDTFGQLTADRYITAIESALRRIADHPAVLRSRPQRPDVYTFYRVNQHYLVCEPIEDKIYVVSIIHARMDVATRLHELEPTLREEARAMSERYRES